MNDYFEIERQLEEDLATAAALISGADRVALEAACARVSIPAAERGLYRLQYALSK